MTPSTLSPPPYCRGCPHPTYDNRHRKGFQWYCRLHSPTGIPCTNIEVLKEWCLRVQEYMEREEAAT